MLFGGHVEWGHQIDQYAMKGRGCGPAADPRIASTIASTRGTARQIGLCGSGISRLLPIHRQMLEAGTIVVIVDMGMWYGKVLDWVMPKILGLSAGSHGFATHEIYDHVCYV